MVFFFCILCLFCEAVFSQNVYQLQRANKAVMKELKQAYGLSSLQICTGDNGFWYYLGCRKTDGKKLYGILSHDKELLVDFENRSVTYVPGIVEAGYADYTFRSMTGGTDNFRLYNHAMPGHFILEHKDGFSRVCMPDGKVLTDSIRGEITYVGSWLFINTVSIYTRELDGFKRLILVNTKTRDMGMRAWDGTELFGDRHFLIYITSKVPSSFNDAFAFDNNSRMGGMYMEDIGSLVPVEYSEMKSIYANMTFEVKLNPADAFHPYEKSKKEKFVPKNEGERLWIARQYEECLNYYVQVGVADADAKLYSASALYNIALDRILKLKNHVEAPSTNKLQNYDYGETRKLLDDAKSILQTAMVQDSARSGLYADITQQCDRSLADLELYNAKLKENSFGNQLLKAVLSGVSEGLKQAALNSVREPAKAVPVARRQASPTVRTTSGTRKVSASSSHRQDSEDVVSPAQEKRKEKCRACGGKGFWVDERISGEYKWCDKCGQNRRPHTHKTCGSCKGTGWK